MAKAEIGPRAIAKIIDAGIAIGLLVPVYIVAFILGRISGALGVLFLLVGALAAFAALIYIMGWGLGETGQTPGKRMQGLKVVDVATGAPIGGAKGIGRMFLESIINSICYANWISAFIDSNNQTVGDKVLTANVVPGEKGGLMPLFPGGKPF